MNESKLAQGRDLFIKIVLIGDGGVGKTTLCRTWLGEKHEGFKTNYARTLGADFAAKKLSLYHSPTSSTYDLKLRIWDLVGQPRFKVVRELYYRGAMGALCFFDVTLQESYNNLTEWINAFWTFNGMGTMPVILVGAKCDLRGNPAFPFQIAFVTAETYAWELSTKVLPTYGFKIHYVETSAKENINVEKPFRLLGYEIISNFAFQEKLPETHRSLKQKFFARVKKWF